MRILPVRKSAHEWLSLLLPNQIEIIFPYAWGLTGDEEIDFRGKIENKALSHGGVEVGDNKASPRTLSLTFYLRENDRESFREELSKYKAYFRIAGSRLYVGNTKSYFNISRLINVKNKWTKAFQGKFSEVTFTLRCADPFRYSDDEMRFVQNMDETEEWTYFSVFCDGNIDTPTIITFTPKDKGNTFSLSSETTGEQFTISDTMLTPGLNTVINGIKGTVYRGVDNAINTMNGVFLSLESGENTLRYKGDAGRITITHRARWF